MLFTANIFTNDKSGNAAQVKIGKELNKKLHPKVIAHTRFAAHHNDKTAFMVHGKELAKAGYSNKDGYVDRKESKAILAMRDVAKEIGFAKFDQLVTFKFEGYKKDGKVENKVETLSHILIAGKRAYIVSVDIDAPEDKATASIKLGKRRKNVVIGRAYGDETKDGNPYFRVTFNCARQEELKAVEVDMNKVTADPVFAELSAIVEKLNEKKEEVVSTDSSKDEEIERLTAELVAEREKNARLVEENAVLREKVVAFENVDVKEADSTNEEEEEMTEEKKTHKILINGEWVTMEVKQDEDYRPASNLDELRAAVLANSKPVNWDDFAVANEEEEEEEETEEDYEPQEMSEEDRLKMEMEADMLHMDMYGTGYGCGIRRRYK
ncbi:hypothetical protein A4L30_10650 [Salmonella enterica subsp. enterica serovar Bovismorbificans]|nr:hypothetical protein [Salmonella enterica subsp. enterica serovar Bovismorbificans]